MKRFEQIEAELREVKPSSALTLSEILGWPGSLRRFLLWIVEARAVDCERVAEHLGESILDARSLIGLLIARGVIEHVPTCGTPVYRVSLRPVRLYIPPEELKAMENRAHD